MALLAFNRTTTNRTLAAGNPAPKLPKSASPGVDGPACNVTSELRGLSGAQYVAIQGTDVTPGSVRMAWTGEPEYATPGLTIPAGGGATVDPALTGMSVNDGGHAHVSFVRQHETFVAVEAPATSKGVIADNVASISPAAQPSHPLVLEVVYAAGWLGGDVSVTGVRADGVTDTEVFPSPGIGGGAVAGFKPFATISSIDNSAPGGVGAFSATVQTTNLLGLILGGVIAAVYKLAVDGVDEAVASIDFTNGTFTPTTVPNGVHDYEVWYNRSGTTGTSTTGVGLVDPMHFHTTS